MVQQGSKLSATAMMRKEIPNILKEQYKDGATFDELWKTLLENKELQKIRINKNKKARYALLQGLTN